MRDDASDPGHPESHVEPWRIRSLAHVAGTLAGPPDREGARRVLAVDGRSGSGKSTFAGRLAPHLPSATIVHVDDVSWHHSFFDWQALLAAHVLEPFRRGEAVSWRPEAWKTRDRKGAISVDSACRWLVLEGVGAGRRELSPLVDALVWVASDDAVARTRGIERDGGDEQAVRFWNEWMAAEIPFLDAHRPWTRANLVVCGTPAIDPRDDEVTVSAR